MKMANEDLWDFWLYGLTYADGMHMLVSSKYDCSFRKMDNALRASDNAVLCFSALAEDENCNVSSAYADLDVCDIKTGHCCFGRLYCIVSPIADNHHRCSFMLYLKEHADDKQWLTAFSVPASNIELVKAAD